ncbi:response regulator transcription factor [Roseofilum sp. BLCC_M154]|uniref:Response regulator transcription factor n=1 Tax=Roseofilum acuticapitatum BLCC-M154 TaxID=3022444 RepID=A0ABT7AN85_9CYAN|nr:response regulator transcription factor [Roseofilum acuticapitatum]MDJ1168357.1 response regulator transcription factor [Roseofilum acuticapitatum BLCC-M154]
MTVIRVVLIEDHDLTRMGLRTALKQQERIEIVGEAANGKQGLEVLKATAPDVALIDIGLPDRDGIEVTQHLRESEDFAALPPIKVLMLTMHDDRDTVLAAFAAGADSYSLKDASIEQLVEAISITYEGNSWIDPAIARIVLHQVQQPRSVEPESEQTLIRSVDPEYRQVLESEPLTDRELEVLELIVAGCNNAAIAEQLYITVGTVKTHVRNILYKLCVDDRTQAAVRALRSGLVG